MFRTICIAAAFVMFGLPVWAAECRDWSTSEFFTAASAEEVARCLSAGSDVNAKDGSGYTPLHWAAGGDDTPAILISVEIGRAHV